MKGGKAMPRTQIIKTTIQVRRDILENWDSVNPILANGEIGFAYDVGRVKIGDGQRTWKELPFFALLTDIDGSGTSGTIIVKTRQEWETQGRKISVKGALYVYTDNDGTVSNAMIKIGDGMSYIIDLPFFLGDAVERLNYHITDYRMHVSERERAFWNSKVTAYIHNGINDVLVLDDGTLQLN